MAYGRKRSYKSRAPRRSYKPRAFSRKKRKYSRKKSTLPKKVARNAAKIAKVAHVVDTTMATHTYHSIFNGSMDGGALGEQQVTQLNAQSKADIVSSIRFLQFFDPTDPVNPIVANGDDATFQRKFHQTLYTKLQVANNGALPVTYRVYLCKARDTTSNQPATDWRLGLNDRIHDSGTVPVDGWDHALFARPSMSAVFARYWTVEQYKKFTLMPGTSKSCKANFKYDYEPAVEQVSPGDYDPEFHGSVWMVVSQGPFVIEDIDGTLMASGNANTYLTGLKTTKKYVTTYDGGANFDTLNYNLSYRDATLPTLLEGANRPRVLKQSMIF